MLQNTGTFFHVFVNKFFSVKSQELGKGLFFEIVSEIKPTTPINSSTCAMKIKVYVYWENFFRKEVPANR